MLKEIRESRGMSQQDLADKSGINKRMIQAYEQGYRDINGAKLSKLVTFCIVLKCHLSEIVDDEQLVKELKALEVEHEADAVPVVRCGECSHYNISGCSEGFGWCEKIDRGVTDGHFCSYGEKMEDKS